MNSVEATPFDSLPIELNKDIFARIDNRSFCLFSSSSKACRLLLSKADPRGNIVASLAKDSNNPIFNALYADLDTLSCEEIVRVISYAVFFGPIDAPQRLNIILKGYVAHKKADADKATTDAQRQHIVRDIHKKTLLFTNGMKLLDLSHCDLQGIKFNKLTHHATKLHLIGKQDPSLILQQAGMTATEVAIEIPEFTDTGFSSCPSIIKKLRIDKARFVGNLQVSSQSRFRFQIDAWKSLQGVYLSQCDLSQVELVTTSPFDLTLDRCTLKTDSSSCKINCVSLQLISQPLDTVPTKDLIAYRVELRNCSFGANDLSTSFLNTLHFTIRECQISQKSLNSLPPHIAHLELFGMDLSNVDVNQLPQTVNSLAFSLLGIKTAKLDQLAPTVDQIAIGPFHYNLSEVDLRKVPNQVRKILLTANQVDTFDFSKLPDHDLDLLSLAYSNITTKITWDTIPQPINILDLRSCSNVQMCINTLSDNVQHVLLQPGLITPLQQARHQAI